MSSVVDTKLKEQILMLEKQLMHYRKDDFEKILADHYVEFGSSGMKYDKTMQLSALDDETGLHKIPYNITDFTIKQLAPNIVHSTYCTTTMASGKKSLRSSIWLLHETQWKMYFHQGTPTM
ncbi:DUF4440 domain-containing protein [Lysinibacillus sphaericus]|uniref:DUF4440 domain-containing protein n=1 Tax=Lysinibacillus sphaericus OT4b.31 TaxID=1285586 RepID=R7ZF46_LYSSH|nr:DUF4440 domain-containing protein [Lysinibacillus sphaericus]EON72708.1 hypothetical protein H131_11223 [Lysinibacillus sphaericus OT4b.31]